MKTPEREKERRDSILIMLLIMVLGFLCILLTSGWALRFAPQWKLPANMESNLNPDGHFLTDQPVNLIEPLDPAILTNPAWYNVYLTPGATFSTWTPAPAATITSTATSVPATVTPLFTNTSLPPASPTATSTIPYYPPPPPPTSTPKPKPRPKPPTPTNTPLPPADLQITKTDNTDYYAIGGSTTYTIVVSNNGPNDVTGATVTDAFSPTQVTGATWTCVAVNTVCRAGSGSGNISDTVNLPVGSSITYTVDITTSTVGGSLVNTARVSASNPDPVPGNNSATDTDQPAFSFPYGNIGTTPDGTSTDILGGSNITLQLGTTLTVGSGSYLVYYPNNNTSPSVQIGAVTLLAGDGTNWYPIFIWGDGNADTDTNIYSPVNQVSSPPNSVDCTSEPDNCVMDPPLLYSSGTGYYGIAIYLDAAGIPANTSISYISIISPGSPPNTVSIDAIQVFP